MHIHTVVTGFGMQGDACICAACGKWLGYGIPFWSNVFGLVIYEDDPRWGSWYSQAHRRNVIWEREHAE